VPALFSRTGHPPQPAASAVAVIGWNDVTTATASTSMSRSSRTQPVVGELDHLREAGPDGPKRGLEIVEHLSRLGTDVAWPDQRPRASRATCPAM
jgi:hypothetical protein